MKKSTIILACIALLVLGIRLYLAFQTPYFSGDQALFTLRQAEYISNHGVPLYEDPLSYGGRTYIFKPLFYYLLAGFSLFMPAAFVGKIVPNLFASFLIVIVFLLAYQITKNDRAALFSAFISGFIPLFFAETINTLSPAPFIFTLLFSATYCFFRINEQRFAHYFVILLAILLMTSSVVVIFLVSLPLYLLLLKLENLSQNKKEIELTIFSIVLALWVELVMFKKYFLTHGPLVIWQNIPSEILQVYFSEISIFDALKGIGVVPLVYGVYSIFEHITALKNKQVYFLISLSFSSGILLWLKLIKLNIGLMAFGLTMAILFSLLYKRTFDYIQKTKLGRYAPLFVIGFILAFIATSAVPSILAADNSIRHAMKESQDDALHWLEYRSPKGAVVLGLPEEGHGITFVAKRKNVMDSNFLNIKNINERYRDMMDIYDARFETDALRLLDKYNVDYIYYSQNAKKRFSKNEPDYVKDETCFRKVYDRYVNIYEVKCRI